MVGMRMVRYSWTEDGVVENCTAEQVVLEQEAHCYHCDNIIEKGDTAFVLCSKDDSVYMLHQACYEKSCEPVGTAWTEEDETLMNSFMEQVMEDAVLEELMQRINQDPAYRDVKAPPEILDRLFVQIAEYEKNTQ